MTALNPSLGATSASGDGCTVFALSALSWAQLLCVALCGLLPDYHQMLSNYRWCRGISVRQRMYRCEVIARLQNR